MPERHVNDILILIAKSILVIGYVVLSLLAIASDEIVAVARFGFGATFNFLALIYMTLCFDVAAKGDNDAD